MSLSCTLGIFSGRSASISSFLPLLISSHSPSLFSSYLFIHLFWFLFPPPLEVCLLKLTFMFLFLCWFCASFPLPYSSPPAPVSRIKLVSRSVACGIRSRTFSLGKSTATGTVSVPLPSPTPHSCPLGKLPQTFLFPPLYHLSFPILGILVFVCYSLAGSPLGGRWVLEALKECRNLIALLRGGWMLRFCWGSRLSLGIHLKSWRELFASCL